MIAALNNELFGGVAKHRVRHAVGNELITMICHQTTGNKGFYGRGFHISFMNLFKLNGVLMLLVAVCRQGSSDDFHSI